MVTELHSNKNEHTYPKMNPLEIYVGISTLAAIKYTLHFNFSYFQ